LTERIERAILHANKWGVTTIELAFFNMILVGSGVVLLNLPPAEFNSALTGCESATLTPTAAADFQNNMTNGERTHDRRRA
jgi:hypothetical protein